jgi:SAM-dependent methyltransferase
MRVLDLGTGLGHVARMAAALVAPQGTVVAVDRSPSALAVARRRAEDAGETRVSFIEGDVTQWVAPEPFDVVIGRLVLFHVADPVAVVRHHIQNLREGGRFVALDFDIGGARSEPPVPILADALRWIVEAFTAAGASPRIGSRLAVILEQAGLRNVATHGVQAYLQPHDPSGAALVAGVVRSLAPVILARGIATAEQLQLDTLQARLTEEIKEAGAVVLPPTVVGAWGRSER